VTNTFDTENEDAYGLGYGSDGRWLPRECIACAAETQLRCAGCRRAVCHNCECPDACESRPAFSMLFSPLSTYAPGATRAKVPTSHGELLWQVTKDSHRIDATLVEEEGAAFLQMFYDDELRYVRQFEYRDMAVDHSEERREQLQDDGWAWRPTPTDADGDAQ
jgi:hypothetical protein